MLAKHKGTQALNECRNQWDSSLNLTLVCAVEYSHLSDIIIKLFKFALLPSISSSEDFRGLNSRMTKYTVVIKY